jgi:hypothetical protein
VSAEALAASFVVEDLWVSGLLILEQDVMAKVATNASA